MWNVSHILHNAKREDKGDYSIYAYYLSLLKQSEVVGDMKKYAEAVEGLKEILEIENENSICKTQIRTEQEIKESE